MAHTPSRQTTGLILAGHKNGKWDVLAETLAETNPELFLKTIAPLFDQGYTETRLVSEYEFRRLIRTTEPNLYAAKRPEFSVTPVEAGNPMAGYTVREDGAPIGRIDARENAHQTECAARMISFSGKLHWALGDACSHMMAAAQDLRVLATMTHDPERLRQSIERVAGGLVAASKAGNAAYEGSLMTGREADRFDAEWQQPNTGPTEDQVREVMAQWPAVEGKAPKPLNVRDTLDFLAALAAIFERGNPNIGRSMIEPAEIFCRRVGVEIPQAETIAAEIDANLQAASVATGLHPDRCHWAAHQVREGIKRRPAQQTSDMPPIPTPRANSGPTRSK